MCTGRFFCQSHAASTLLFGGANQHPSELAWRKLDSLASISNITLSMHCRNMDMLLGHLGGTFLDTQKDLKEKNWRLVLESRTFQEMPT